MDQPDLAQSLPGILTRSEGSLSLCLGVFDILPFDVTLDNFLWTVAQPPPKLRCGGYGKKRL